MWGWIWCVYKHKDQWDEAEWGLVGELSLEREVNMKSWRPRQVSGLYSKSDTSLEFYEKESDTIQLMYPLAKITLAAVWRLDCGARLEAHRPVMILNMSNLEIMLAIEVVRRVNFWYIIRQRQWDLLMDWMWGWLGEKESNDNLLDFELSNWVQGSVIYWKEKEWIWGDKLWSP